MASKITDDSAPVPETSTSTILGGGSGSGPAEGFMQMLHQIQETLMDINKTLKAQNNLGTVESSASQGCHGIEVGGASEGIASPLHRDRLRDAVMSSDCDKLLELANELPEHQFQQALIGGSTDPYGRSALHVAVMEGSEKLVETLLTKMQAYESSRFGGTPSTLRDFVYMVDSFGLTASDMAVIIGNVKILHYFHKAAIFRYFHERIPHSVEPEQWVDDRRRELGPILNQPSDPSGSETWIDNLHLTRGYEYCLHQAAETENFRFVKHVCESRDRAVLEPLLGFRDAKGRTPLHVGLIDLPLWVDNFLQNLIENFLEPLITHIPSFDLNVTDYMGRTPLHYAAAQGLSSAVIWLAAKRETDLNATFNSISDWHFGTLYENPKFTKLPVKDVTALHLAVIHNHVEVVEALLKVTRDESSELTVNAVCRRYVQDGLNFDFTPFQLAAYMGHVQILQMLLKDDRCLDCGIKKNKIDGLQTYYGKIPALHLATSQFHTLAVKALVDSEVIDAFAEDEDGDMALHCAAIMANGDSKVSSNTHDYVSISHFQLMPPKSTKPSDNDIITCIDILIQTGVDMQYKNKSGSIPMLSSSCSPKVQKWWLKKMAIEAQENKNSLTMAANAISVTAALVATASFVGPLQPPLGLFNDGSSTWLTGYSQVRHTSVEVFIFCDNLSFYLAIASIVFAMLPSWQIPHEGLVQEVRIAQRCVKVAILLLFASIIFIVCAFSATSIAIVLEERWRYKALTVISISLGTLVCSFILSLSFMRLLTLISSRSKWARRISNVANSIMLWNGPSH